MKVGEGDAWGTSVSDIFREGPKFFIWELFPFMKGADVTCCHRMTIWFSLVDACLFTVRLRALLGSNKAR